MMKKGILNGFLIFLMFSFLETSAQKQKAVEKLNLKSSIRVIAKSYGDSVVLRWAPDRPWAWYKLNAMGYKIERLDISDKDMVKKEWLIAAPLKPYTLEKFKTVFKPDNSNAAVAAQCLYGTNFETNMRQGQPAIADKANVTTTRYAFALQASDFDAGVAEATALRFTDKNVKKGGTYIYRVVPAAIATQGIIDTGIVMVNNNPIASPVPKINDAVAGDLMAELHWDRQGTDSWSGYFIERSTDGKIFTQVNKLPFISSVPDSSVLKQDSTKARYYALLATEHVFIDSLPRNYTNFYYRIRGVNAFAEKSGYSNSVLVIGRDMTAPVAVDMLNPLFIKDRMIKVLWKKNSIEPDCKGYYITRSKNINGPYETLNKQLIPANVNEFIDEAAYAHGRNFYMVVAVDTANNISTSVPAMGLVPDTTAPLAPIGITGKVEKNGLVFISWKKNKEEDIKGYKVYFANEENHVFTQLTTDPEADSLFVDSIGLKTLTKNIWYKVVAVDENNNHSAFSETIKLRKPDIVPPMPPLPKQVKVDTAGVTIQWIKSASDDVIAYQVFRKPENGEWERINSITVPKDSIYFNITDKNPKPMVRYQYSVEAIDEDSLHSTRSVVVNAVLRTIKDLPAINSLKVAYDEKTKQVKLSWQYEAKGDYYFVVSRSLPGEPMSKFRSFEMGVSEWTDNLQSLSPGNVSYSIQAIYRSGGKTAPSTVQSIQNK